jgi:heme o synthase
LTTRSSLQLLRSLPSLTRIGVTLAVTFSAAVGYIVSSGHIDIKIINVLSGVFLLAGGASALNQFQERKTDALMERTKNRPIPSGKISPLTGILISEILCIVGLIPLVLIGIIPALLGLFNILWYNGLYTYIKKKTAFAVVPGALTGVVPLLIGWTAAGGHLLDPRIIFISFFIFMWQIPHFWLLLIKFSDDYKKAGLGYLYHSFSSDQVKRIVFVWIIATSLASLLLLYIGIIHSSILFISALLLNILLIAIFYFSIFKVIDEINYKIGFVSINAFLFLILFFLICESLFIL